MLTGTLVTASGFLPVGFAKSSTGEYAGGIFWIVGLALLASWIVAVVFTPYLGLTLLPDMGKHGTHGDPNALYDTRIYRALRRVARARQWPELTFRHTGGPVAGTGFGADPTTDCDAVA